MADGREVDVRTLDVRSLQSLQQTFENVRGSGTPSGGAASRHHTLGSHRSLLCRTSTT